MSDYSPVPQPNYQGPVIAAKDNTIAYLLWFFLGEFGVHRFYLRSPWIGSIYLVLGVLGWATVWFVVGFIFLIPLWIMWIIDFFLIPERTRRINSGQIR